MKKHPGMFSTGQVAKALGMTYFWVYAKVKDGTIVPLATQTQKNGKVRKFFDSTTILQLAENFKFNRRIYHVTNNK